MPLIVTEDITDGTPTYLKATYCLHWPPSRSGDQSLMDELVQGIYRAQEQAPPLGRPPAFLLAAK